MKIRNISIGTFAIATVLLATSCSQDMMTDINRNPNQADMAPLSTVVTSTLTGSILPVEGENARMAGIWSQTFTGLDRQYAAYDVYNVNSNNFDWVQFYYGAIQQANVSIEKAKSNKNMFYSGICTVIKANAFGNMTALWGDIPFSEANDLFAFPNPKLDPQREVYNGVQSLLDEAISDLESGVGNDVDGVDFFYAGDAAKWAKAAYSMKARYYLHTGDLAKAKDAASKGILDAAENMMIPHAGTYGQNMNIYASFGQQDRQGYMGATDAFLPTILDTNGIKNDAKTNEGERFADLYVGAGNPADYDLNYSGSLFSATSSFPVITAEETHLIMAEVAFEEGDRATAVTHLNHVRQILAARYPGSQYDDYAEADLPGDELKKAILLEKYASLVGQLEVFNDIRRTKNFIGLTPKGTATKLPQRFLIPQDELNGNPNITSAGDLFDETPVNK